MITSVTITGTVYYLNQQHSHIYCSTTKIPGEPRQLMAFDLKNGIWNKTELLPIPQHNLIVLEKVIRAVMM